MSDETTTIDTIDVSTIEAFEAALRAEYDIDFHAAGNGDLSIYAVRCMCSRAIDAADRGDATEATGALRDALLVALRYPLRDNNGGDAQIPIVDTARGLVELLLRHPQRPERPERPEVFAR